MESKQDRIKKLVNDLLKELQGEPYWKAHWILHFLKKWLIENLNFKINAFGSMKFPVYLCKRFYLEGDGGV